MASNMQQRIDYTAKVDLVWGSAFVLVLWVVYAFVFVEVTSIVANPGVRLALIIGGALVVVFNTAAIVAMLRQFAAKKQATYEPDIRHLDEKRAMQQANVGVG